VSRPSVAQVSRTTLDGEWRVIDADGRLPPPETRMAPPVLRFDTTAGRLTGTTGVNSFTGTLVVEGETLRLGPAATTRRAGPQPAMEFESAMLGALQRAAGWRIAGGTLSLLDAGGATLMRLEPTP
jgi:heat shock protein HslJ